MPKPASRNQVKTSSETWRSGRRLLPAAALAILVVIALAVMTRPASPQLESSQSQTTAEASPVPPPDPPGTIDGAKNPELIPDDEAYRVVFIALAEHENATDAEKARFRDKIAAAGLGDDDREALFTILTALQKQLDTLQAQVSAITATDPFPHPDSVDYQKLLDLTKQYKADFAEAMSAVPARLSADGVAKLDAYVKGEKRGMKYVPDMQPPN